MSGGRALTRSYLKIHQLMLNFQWRTIIIRRMIDRQIDRVALLRLMESFRFSRLSRGVFSPFLIHAINKSAGYR